jgi:hypothetical protein
MARARTGWWERWHPGWAILTIGGTTFDTVADIQAVRARPCAFVAEGVFLVGVMYWGSLDHTSIGEVVVES